MSYSVKKMVYEFDPFKESNLDRPESKRELRSALREIAEYVKDELLQHYGDGESPVSGKGRFKQLSKSYEEFKKKHHGSAMPNMELNGDMLDSIEYKIQGNKILIGWFDSDESAKAYGHQSGYKGHPTIKNGPVRQLLPNSGQKLKPDIREGIKAIASELIEED
jgi:phage gpG-like protein